MHHGLTDKLVFIHSNIRLVSRFQENFKEGPFKKWDVDPEERRQILIDDSQVRLEEMRWKSLERNDGTQQEHSQPDERFAYPAWFKVSWPKSNAIS